MYTTENNRTATEYIVLSYTVKESCRTYTSAEFCPQHRNNLGYSALAWTKKNLKQSWLRESRLYCTQFIP